MKMGIKRIISVMKSNSIINLFLIFTSALSYIFANGRWGVPILAWIYPFLFLSLIKTSKSAKSVFVIYVIYSVGFVIQWVDVLGMGFGICVALSMAFSGIKTLPYIAYHKLRRNKDSFTVTILLSAAMVLAEYIIYLINPILAGLSDVYTQYQNLLLMNLSSLFGVYGISFVMYWTAAVAVWLSNYREIGRGKKGIITYAAVIVSVFLYGVAMLNLPISESNTVRVASITVPVKELLENDYDVSKVFYSDSFTDENLMATKEKLSAVHDELFRKTIEEAEAGAKIIFWSELNGAVMEDDENQLITQAAEVAKEYSIYLVISLLTKTPYEKYKDNKAIMISPKGEVVSEFFKTVRSPGELCIEGSGKMESFTSEYGKLTAFICSDMASSTMIGQAGRNGVDIIIVPASDWKEMTPITIKTAIVRGIENGCSVVRQTNMGISVAADYSGRLLAYSNYYTSERKCMVSEIPTKGRFTIYPYIGNAFPWCCALCLGLSFLIYFRKGRNKKSQS